MESFESVGAKKFSSSLFSSDTKKLLIFNFLFDRAHEICESFEDEKKFSEKNFAS